jgi:2-amino-4-hydroxy-6-hydroxymethyldihydropteridine diphosphokinase
MVHSCDAPFISKQQMNTVYLIIGGNLGDREHNLEQARDLLAIFAGDISKASGIYETAAWGKTDQPAFLNQALRLQTALTPRKLLQTILKIEKTLGRKREEKYGPRLIDIDILLYNQEIVEEEGLSIPHPEMQQRKFVLLPLAEIAGKITHPISQTTIAEMLSGCGDTLNVKKFS